MDVMITYKSYTGFAERVAQRIAYELNCPCDPIRKINMMQLFGYQVVFFVGSVENGKIAGLNNFLSMNREFSPRVIIIAVGAKPAELVDMEKLSQEVPKDDKHFFFYVQGGLKKEKINFLRANKFRKFIDDETAKASESLEQKAFAELLKNDFNALNEEAIKPIFDLYKTFPDPYAADEEEEV